ncbi:MAG: PAS domain S-box protein [Rubrivivax sp.]|nr:MAG: PAS domain S-box protein [Rubrivivax sp.]
MKALLDLWRMLFTVKRSGDDRRPGEHPSAHPDALRLAAIVGSSYDAIIGKSLDGTITDWNAAAERMFGYTADEAIGQSIRMLIPPELAAEEMGIIENLSSGQHVAPFNTLRRTKDGRLIDVSITVSPIRDEAGRIVGAAKIARDVTQQRRAEAALRESDARLRFTLDAACVGHWRLDLATRTVQGSTWFAHCFGHEVSQPGWTLDDLIRRLHPDDRIRVAHSWRKALDNQEDFRTECRVVWPDDSLHWISLRGTTAYGAQPQHSMMGIIADVTLRKQAEAERAHTALLAAENRRILDATQAKSLFLANMSHELRTPLNAIIGFADLLSSGLVPFDSPKHDVFLGHIQNGGRHLLQLINDVLDLSKVEAGKLEFSPEAFDLGSLIKETIDVLHTQVIRKRIHIDIDVDPALRTGLFLDPSRLKQILFNCLSNAIKFSPEDGLIVVTAQAEGQAHFRIEVEDSGPGIADDAMDKLFLEYSQIDSAVHRHHEGTGLGLALVRRLTEAQGGQVGARSTLGVGSVFWVVLNRVHGTDGARADEALVAAAPRSPRLLLVHDGLEQRDRFVHALREAGAKVDVATTAVSAQEHLQAGRYDAMALQLALPDQSGLALLARIRQAEHLHAPPVIGLLMHGNQDRTAAFGIADILAKPARGDQLLAALERNGLTLCSRKRVLVIDDEPECLDQMETLLLECGMVPICQIDGGAALTDVEKYDPEAIIIDLVMPGLNGLDVLERLRQMPACRNRPVFVWTGMALSKADHESLRESARSAASRDVGLLGLTLTEVAQRLGCEDGLTQADVH